jgi:serine phosphatase RsbU (regulator of sigma subunit)
VTSSSRQPSRRRPPPWQGDSLYALQYVEEVLLELDVGEVALFYSDGLVEAHDPKGEMFGFPRLRELVARHGEDRPLDETLLEELYSFTGEGWEQEDDITLLTLQRSAARS